MNTVNQPRISEQAQFIEHQDEVNVDLRGFYLKLEDLIVSDAGVLSLLKQLIGEERFNMFSWTEDHDGTNILIHAVLHTPTSTEVLSEIQHMLTESSIVIQCEKLPVISSDRVTQNTDDSDKIQDFPYATDWYWELKDRLPRSAYTNLHPIPIVQADTGITTHPNLIGGFDKNKSMDFFYPPSDRKGRGVIEWGASHPFFISHGTGTGGLMIGANTGDLALYGMAPRGVVELIPCRVSDSVVLNAEDVKRLADCINWAVEQKAKVVNISLGTIATANDPAIVPLTKAIKNAYDNGVIVCCAAGQILTGMIWPAVYALKGWCICCGPSTKSNDPWGVTIWVAFAANYVTVSAPGEFMPRAAWKDDNRSTNEATVIVSEGSSYSTAFVSSVAALWWALNHEQLSKRSPRDIVPLFRNTLTKSCKAWKGGYPKETFGPGILNPNLALVKGIKELENYKVECSGFGSVARVKGGTYKDVTLHAHGSGSVHVVGEEIVFVEGKLTLIAESSGTISMTGTVICRELEIICASSSTILADDLEYYDSCKVNVSASSTCKLYLTAEGSISGEVKGWSTFIAWIFWRNGRKTASISAKDISGVHIKDWGGRWV